MQLEFRPAQPADAEQAVPLIYSAGPQAFDYGFNTRRRDVREFLHHCFAERRGLFGCDNHAVVLLDGRIAGVGAFYSGHESAQLTRDLVLQVLRFYALAEIPGVVRRALQVGALSPAPPPHMQFVADLGVRPDLQGRGIGAALLRHQQQRAAQLGRAVYALDVSVENPRAQALYQRYGFRVTAERRFGGTPGAVPGVRRMEMPVSG